jgi:cell division protein FtsB
MFRENVKVALVVLVVVFASVWFNRLAEHARAKYISSEVVERTDQRYEQIIKTLDEIKKEIEDKNEGH